MRWGIGRAARLQTACAVVAFLAAGLPASTVMAEDSGIGAFFREQFGIGAGSAPSQEPYYEEPFTRQLTVQPRRRAAKRVQPAKIAVGPVVPVSIYEDKTLKAGDAVMTAKGLRVFTGGHTMPYTEADFVALADADRLPRQVQKVLSDIDKAPRS